MRTPAAYYSEKGNFTELPSVIPFPIEKQTGRTNYTHLPGKKKIGQEKIKICLVLFLGEESRLILMFISEALADAAMWILFPSRHVACFPGCKAIWPQSSVLTVG